MLFLPRIDAQQAFNLWNALLLRRLITEEFRHCDRTRFLEEEYCLEDSIEDYQYMSNTREIREQFHQMCHREGLDRTGQQEI